MFKAPNADRASANLQILRDRIARGLMTKASLYPLVLGTSTAAFYASIRRREIEVVDVGRTKLLPPREGARLIGLEVEPLAA